ncbi:molybdenum cofactor biosynthesis prote [Leucogyrophana mollusca]|uniref:Molybdenum cofactor biosynthesis prote n=1 Tax=Leucogyrophana mollusca TaxID=85980 RepID=A0ACB8BCT7_9AGAM|nr:molybdenum cofactor biosynthesis prote [Leucogyrophana mollusca]
MKSPLNQHSIRCFPRGLRSLVYARNYSQPAVLDSKHRAQAKIAHIDSNRPFSPALIDSFQRRHDYLRISLTERCNLRCFYCMPSEGIELSPKDHILSDDEVIRLASLFVKSGVTKIRLTGGEPTVRKGLGDIIGKLNELRTIGLKSIGMTSNGLVLHRRLPQYVENGLTHLNLSLDTLDPFKFEIMTRRPGHDVVLRALEAALLCPGLQSVKLNVVVVKGLNDSEIFDFVDLAKDKDVSIRFIEFMPFTGNKWDKAKMVPSSQLLEKLSERYPDITRAPDELNDTARSWKIPGHRGSIGFISSMSDHFCASCNRLRLTADGMIKVCLFDAKEISLRDEMRRGASDDELLQLIGRAVLGKQEKHAGMEDIDVATNRPMILIGGVTPRNPERPIRPPILARHNPYGRQSQFSGEPMDRQRQRRWSSSSASSTPRLTHIDEAGRPSMVNVGEKQSSKRTATASGRIYIPKVAYDLVTSSHFPAERQNSTESSALERAKEKARNKGDVLTVAQLAAVMGCKRTSELIPLCHPLLLSHISVALAAESSTSGDKKGSQYSIYCSATVSCEGKTGVEMEALTAVSVGLLTVWDMLKAVAGKEMLIGDIIVTHKEGGKSGDFVR